MLILLYKIAEYPNPITLGCLDIFAYLEWTDAQNYASE